jgi:hypothetical protein
MVISFEYTTNSKRSISPDPDVRHGQHVQVRTSLTQQQFPYQVTVECVK